MRYVITDKKKTIGELVWCGPSQGHYIVTDVIRNMLGKLYHKHHIDLFHESTLTIIDEVRKQQKDESKSKSMGQTC